MPVSTSDDPVQTVLDILTASTEADYVNRGEKPGKIERHGRSSPGDKASYRRADAMYAYSPADSFFEKFGTDDGAYLEEQTVAVELWVVDSETELAQLVSDVIEILYGYANDSQEETNWQTIVPVSDSDSSHERTDRRDHVRNTVTAELSRLVVR